MIIFSLLFQVVIAIVVVSGQYVGQIGQLSQQQSSSGSSSSSSASSSSSNQNINNGNYISGPIAYGPGPVPRMGIDARAQTTYASQSYNQNKGEILIHRPAPIIVKRPPTKVVVNHPPLVVKPAPVVLHKPPPVVMRKVFVKQHPRPVKVEPVYVNVVKPPAEKYYVNDRMNRGSVGTVVAPCSRMQAVQQAAVQQAAAQQQYALARSGQIPL